MYNVHLFIIMLIVFLIFVGYLIYEFIQNYKYHHRKEKEVYIKENDFIQEDDFSTKEILTLIPSKSNKLIFVILDEERYNISLQKLKVLEKYSNEIYYEWQDYLKENKIYLKKYSYEFLDGSNSKKEENKIKLNDDVIPVFFNKEDMNKYIFKNKEILIDKDKNILYEISKKCFKLEFNFDIKNQNIFDVIDFDKIVYKDVYLPDFAFPRFFGMNNKDKNNYLSYGSKIN